MRHLAVVIHREAAHLQVHHRLAQDLVHRAHPHLLLIQAPHLMKKCLLKLLLMLHKAVTLNKSYTTYIYSNKKNIICFILETTEKTASSKSQEKQLPVKTPALKTTPELKLKESQSNLSSTEDDDRPKSPSKKAPTNNEKKKVAQQKTTVVPPPSIPPYNGGGKAPPSVMKQHQALQQQNKALAAAKLSSTASMTTPVKTSTPKLSVVKKGIQALATGSKVHKKKSIFSPDNSSESEDEKPSPPKNDRRLSNSSATAAGRGRGRPRKYPISSSTAVSKIAQKVSASEKQKVEIKKDASSATSTTESSASASSNSDSDSESARPSRKSARMSSVRKSKHLGTSVKSETETDESNKRSSTKSPVKKVPSLIPTKGKSKHKKIEQKHNLNLSKDSSEVNQGCPLEGCNSNGHLSGKFEKHFTLEACPMYHNVALVETKQNLNERKKRDEERMKAMREFEPKKPSTNEQKAYLQKIRDIRSKFKPVSKSLDDSRSLDDLEPNLAGKVSDYDLQLFRDAQALASENIENELMQLPCRAGCTKYVVMGKHNMEVWYQSVYPEDVQRLPKLYLCEFCLRYQKSEVGMKRHAAKCVWRHPPGDEIYRKGKLCVWQVDGKRHKNYCQYLCLLAKFFLDHKTLYFDVDPFLFYIMTIADSDGCHIVGYFSKVSNSL